METPKHRAAFDRVTNSAKAAGILKAIYPAEGIAIIEIPVVKAEAPPPSLTPGDSSPPKPLG